MQEVVSFLRRPSFPGVEVFAAQHSRRSWGHFNATFVFGTMYDWNGRLDYRRRNLSLNTGETFLFDPGELFHAEPAESRPGTFRVIEILPKTFEALCQAEGSRAPVHFARATTKATPQLAAVLDSLQTAVQEDAEPLQQQSLLAMLAHCALTTVLEPGPRALTKPAPLGPCERLREILHSSEAPHINLCDFARHAGVSQFQLLRSFKRRYGSPPHAYGLHVRLERARQMLRHGFSVTETAAAANFTDQSHLPRHFRKLWGITPGQYAAVGL